MPFHTIDQIRRTFDIQEADSDDIRRELRRRLKKIHPDTNSGMPPSGGAENEEVLRITAALNFLDDAKRLTAVVPVEEVTALVRAIKELVPFNREKEAGARLSRLIDARAKEAMARGRLFRMILSAAALALTALWLFPSMTESHPVLHRYINVKDTVFNVLWIALLLYAGATWLVCALWRQRDIEEIRSLGLAFTQQRLFRSFIQSKAEMQKEQKRIFFYKDEFAAHLEGFGEGGARASRPFSGRARHVDPELAEMLADIIIAAAADRGVIRKDKQQSLREAYVLIADINDL